MSATLKLVAASLLVLIAQLVLTTIWSVCFGKLSKIPGPKLAAATRLVNVVHKARGDAEAWRLKLHLEYGDVVRVAPTEVSFSNGAAWQDIYGYAPASKYPKLSKDPAFYGGHEEHQNLDVIEGPGHIRQRKCFSSAFSETALRQQEPLIRQYVDQLVTNVERIVPKQEKIDLSRQFNYTTFDIMADLAFGEPLGCLLKSDYVSWITSIFGALKLIAIVGELNYYPTLKRLFEASLPRSLQEKKQQHIQFSVDRVEKRLARETSRSDIWGFVLANEEKNNKLTRGEMHANAGLFMIAGTETTATTLAAMTYYLLKNPDKMRKVVEEIRGQFTSASEICVQNVLNLRYLTACTSEAQRLHPPVPIGLPRTVPKGGAEICGYSIPEGTSVYVHQLGTYRNPRNFTRPNEYLPQRWLPKSNDAPQVTKSEGHDTENSTAEFAKDDESCFHPFLMGPRICIGINLAWLEIRLIMANLLWRFDFELCEKETGDWDDQEVYSLWASRPLFVTAKHVVR